LESLRNLDEGRRHTQPSSRQAEDLWRFAEEFLILHTIQLSANEQQQQQQQQPEEQTQFDETSHDIIP
jgi:hypothetical protein